MKKALQLLLAQFLWLIAGVIIGTFFYSLYIHSISQVAGQSSSVWSKENLAVSIFVATQIFAFISGFLLITHKIRLPGGVLQMVSFVLCQCLMWGLLFPLSNHLEEKFVANRIFAEGSFESQNLSQGYFRKSENEVYYFLNRDNSRAVKIETTEKGASEIVQIDDISDLSIVKNAKPYRDILISDTFKQSDSEYTLFGTLLFSAKRDMNHGITFWLGFLTMILALSSIYAISGLSGWRIANFTICGVLYGLVLFVNGFYWSPAMASFRNLGFLHAGLFKAMSYDTSAPLLVILNSVFALALIITGSIKFFLKKKRGR